MPPAAKPPGTNWIGAGCVGLLLLGGPILAGLRGLMHRVPAYRGWQESLTSLIQSNDLAGLAWYVRLGREVNEVDAATGSHVVFYTGDPATIGFLIDAGMDPDARDSEGDTLLQESVRANQLDTSSSCWPTAPTPTREAAPTAPPRSRTPSTSSETTRRRYCAPLAPTTSPSPRRTGRLCPPTAAHRWRSSVATTPRFWPATARQ